MIQRNTKVENGPDRISTETTIRTSTSRVSGSSCSNPLVSLVWGPSLTSVPIPAKLRTEIEGYCSSVTAACPEPELHGMLELGSDLHISLSHAFPLRQYQIASFKARLADCLLRAKTSRFHASLAGRVKVYYNGRRYGGDGHGGRAFLALRVGAGGKEVSSSGQSCAVRGVRLAYSSLLERLCCPAPLVSWLVILGQLGWLVLLQRMRRALPVPDPQFTPCILTRFVLLPAPLTSDKRDREKRAASAPPRFPPSAIPHSTGIPRLVRLVSHRLGFEV